MSLVSAVVLSSGEPFVNRAMESIARQTVPLHEVIVIEHVSPFSKALNQGAARVATPYFVQVDADMILDADCVARLMLKMDEETGLVVGELRDAICGQLAGVKLYRTECFLRATLPDSISPDTDHVDLMRRQGWRTVYLGPDSDAGTPLPTVGEHRPDYAPSYTFAKMSIEGARYRYRGSRTGVLSHMQALEHGGHPMAVLAQIALSHGLFSALVGDQLVAPIRDARGDVLARWLAGDGRAAAVVDQVLPLTRYRRLRDVYRQFVAAGRALGRDEAGATVRETFEQLTCANGNWRALVAKVALGHGVLDVADTSTHAHDERTLSTLFVFGLAPSASWPARWRAYRQDVLQRGFMYRAGLPW